MKKLLTKTMKEIKTEKGSILISYWTPVAFVDNMGHAFRTSKFWSVTTSRHIRRWFQGQESYPINQEVLDALYKKAT